MKKADTSKSTILVISIGFLALYLIFSWQWAVYISLGIGLVGIISVKLSKLVEKAWFGLSKILSYIVPTILLGILFFLLLYPISLISRLFTKDPLMLSNRYNSYFVAIDNNFDKESLKKIW